MTGDQIALLIGGIVVGGCQVYNAVMLRRTEKHFDEVQRRGKK